MNLPRRADSLAVELHVPVGQPGSLEDSIEESVDVLSKVPTQIHGHPNLFVKSIGFSKFQ
jgi:hypothetical protein